MFIILQCLSGGELAWISAHDTKEAAIEEASTMEMDVEDMICVVGTEYFQQKL